MEQKNLPQGGKESDIVAARAEIAAILPKPEDQNYLSENFPEIFNKIQVLRGKYSEETFEKAWSREVVVALIEAYEKYNFENEEMGHFGMDYPFCASIFSSSSSGVGKRNLNDLLVEVITKRLEDGKRLSSALEQDLGVWLQDFNLVSNEKKVALILAVMNHPLDQNNYLREALAGSLALSAGVSFLEEYANKAAEEKDLLDSLKILEILDYVKRAGVNISVFQEQGMKVQKIVEKIKSSQGSYFLAAKAASIEQYPNSPEGLVEYRRRTKRLLERYTDPELKAKFTDEDFAWHYDREKQMSVRPLKHSLYAKLSDKFGVIYDPEGNVDGYFHLSYKSESDSRKFRITLADILKQEGFQRDKADPREFETLLATFNSLVQLPLREKIENDFGIKLADYSVREQAQFVNFLATKNVLEVERAKNFVRQGFDSRGKSNRLLSFLSLEIEQANGHRIIEIGENLSPEAAEKVFGKIGEIIKLSEAEDKELLNILFEGRKAGFAPVIKWELLKKAHSIIVKFGNELRKEGADKIQIEKFLANLESSKIEIDLLASMLKAAKFAKEKIDCGEIKHLELSEKSIGEDLSKTEKQEILEIAKENYFNDIYKDNPEAAEEVIRELEEELEDIKNQRAYILKYQEHAIAFCRFKPIEGKPGEVYAGSLNVYHDLQNFSVGSYFIRTILKRESKENIIHAITRADNLANAYYKHCGFVFGEKFGKNGVEYYKIEMDKRRKGK